MDKVLLDSTYKMNVPKSCSVFVNIAHDGDGFSYSIFLPSGRHRLSLKVLRNLFDRFFTKIKRKTFKIGCMTFSTDIKDIQIRAVQSSLYITPSLYLLYLSDLSSLILESVWCSLRQLWIIKARASSIKSSTIKFLPIHCLHIAAK